MPLRVYLVDLDGVVVVPGTKRLLPGVKEYLKELSKEGHIWFFSCWAFNREDLTFLESLEVPFDILSKPYAEEYVYIDDKLLLDKCNISLGVLNDTQRNS